ncbi:MAG: cell wall hydrolase [Hyphomicrobiales bacterium]|nr:MAG: cell wall hydrolase [Hyphomicrobiales bacterium]
MTQTHLLTSILLAATVISLGSCAKRGADDTVTAFYTEPDQGSLSARECLMRAMYFESNRSSQEGLLAVGTVVMNRVESPDFPSSVCEVVGQHKQFAAGVLTREMRGNTKDIAKLAEAVLDGKRHPGVKQAKFFHMAGLRFPYKNMHYVLIAGGNAFYEKRKRRRR